MPGGEPNASVCLEPDAARIRQRLLEVFSGNAVSSLPASTIAAPSGPEAPATASAEIAGAPASHAADGDLETSWNSGQNAEQWILLDLGAPRTLARLRLHVAQDPAGTTHHQIWVGGDPGNLALIHEFQGLTTDRDVLEFIPTSPLADIRFVKVITLQSPSWVAWREIEVSAE